MPAGKALLLVTMEPLGIAEDEFNDWYDTEHVPERAGLPGFETALRYVCVSGWPKYLAVYDLSDLQALYSPEYGRVSGEHFSPWSKRVAARTQGRVRYEGRQLYPGDRVTGAGGRLGPLAFLRIRGVDDGKALLDGLLARLDGDPAVEALRLFQVAGDDGQDYLALVELRRPLADLSLGPAPLGGARAVVDLANLYVPYARRGQLPLGPAAC
jgi:hypothetical protein